MAHHRRPSTLDVPSHWGTSTRTTGSQKNRVSADKLAWLWVRLVLTCYLCSSAHAQGALGLDPTGRSGESPSLLRDRPPPSPPPGQVLPPVPPPLPGIPEQLPFERVFVREIQITGSTVFSAAELAEVTNPYVDRYLTAEDIEALRLALTQYYVNRGYVSSGAIIPEQTVAEGVLTLHIIEGELTRIEVEGNRWFRASYFQDRLALSAGPPLNIHAMQERLQLLLQDARIERLNAELRPGVQPGESVLEVRVAESNPYKVWLTFNNYQTPSVGAEVGLITVAHQNLTGHGDILSVQYGGSAGSPVELDASYALPITARDTIVMPRYRKNTFLIVEAPFQSLDTSSESEIIGITLRQPVYRTLSQEFTLEIIGERLSSQTFLLDQPFSFSLGAHNGLSTDTAIRLAQEWAHRTPSQVLVARSRFSVGIDALGATINPPPLPDGRFFAWLGQLQWVRRLSAWEIEMLFRADLQLAKDPLLPLEQIAVGGRYSVRGYRENQLVRDNAFLASVESRIPVIRDRRWAEFVQVAPFVDVGQSWNTHFPTPAPTTLASIGLGLRWAATLTYPFPMRPQFEVYWGLQLNHVKTPGGNLQDDGVSFQVSIALF